MNTNIGAAAETLAHYIRLAFEKANGAPLSSDCQLELSGAVEVFRQFEQTTDASFRTAFDQISEAR